MVKSVLALVCGTVAAATPLAWLGASPTTPLRACQGDCDKDADCAWGDSKCIERTGGKPAAVTGCTVGDSGATARADTDYCSNPSWTNALAWLGDSPATPLKACQGDCDKDADCAGASTCIQRTKGTPAAVTGCTVGDSGATARADDDYCSNPTWTAALAWLGASPTTPLKACLGDCDKDADCAGASTCIERAGGKPAAVTGCTVGDSGATARADTDYCSNPGVTTVTVAAATWTNALAWLGDSPTTPLKACQGDCDKDADCAGASKCIQRTKGKPAAVAGCTVGDSGATLRADDDYCSNPNAWTNALAWLGDSPTTPLKACQGDCDKDADCAGASKCIQRTKGTPAAVTGCTVGDSGATARADDDYCSNPTWTNALAWLGASPTTPLKACQGDCDKDADCAGASTCIERTKGKPAAVAGCTVGDSGATARADTDYCTNPVTTSVGGSSSAAGLHAWNMATGTAVVLAISVTQ